MRHFHFLQRLNYRDTMHKSRAQFYCEPCCLDETLLPNQLVVHPNPSHGKIHLTWNNIQAEHLEIRTMHGALVYAESIENMNATDIDISELPRGIYFIQIGTHMQRVILD